VRVSPLSIDVGEGLLYITPAPTAILRFIKRFDRYEYPDLMDLTAAGPITISVAPA
jgi:hypothetical protein